MRKFNHQTFSWWIQIVWIVWIIVTIWNSLGKPVTISLAFNITVMACVLVLSLLQQRSVP